MARQHQPVSAVPAVCQPCWPALCGASFLTLPKAARGRKWCCIVVKMRKQARKAEALAPGHTVGRRQGWTVWCICLFQPCLTATQAEARSAHKVTLTEAAWSLSFLGHGTPCVPASLRSHPVSNSPLVPRCRLSPRPRPEKGHVQTPPSHLTPQPLHHAGPASHSRGQPCSHRGPNNPPNKEMSLKSLFSELRSWTLGKVVGLCLRNLLQGNLHSTRQMTSVSAHVLTPQPLPSPAG